MHLGPVLGTAFGPKSPVGGRFHVKRSAMDAGGGHRWGAVSLENYNLLAVSLWDFRDVNYGRAPIESQPCLGQGIMVGRVSGFRSRESKSQLSILKSMKFYEHDPELQAMGWCTLKLLRGCLLVLPRVPRHVPSRVFDAPDSLDIKISRPSLIPCNWQLAVAGECQW